MRILLIEDDSLIGDGIKTGLENFGFAVDWFKDGEDFLIRKKWRDENG